jgi:AraC family transcriptional regulator, regulatory protein of adaptative response / DNA-3-methyladenine glycosylase II
VLDPETSYLALRSRDPRFDGRLFVGVTSTGIYCRPVCPARPAKFAHCRFFPSAAAAQEAGFRPCLRCRPEVVAELGSWLGTSNTVSRALTLIAQGELDEDGLETFAERLGVGGRQLRRLFHQHLGASPVAVAQTRRVLFAKQLLHETQMPMAQVALAAGFGSVRRFNELFLALFHRPPSALRRSMKPARGTGVTVRLRYRAPYDWEAMRGYLAARAIDGVEHLDRHGYSRTVRHEGEAGTIHVTHLPSVQSFAATIRFPRVRSLAALVARVRRVFDLDADVKSIGAVLARDPLLAKLISARPGLRTPGAWDGFELAMRAILGQQVTVSAGRKLASKLVAACAVRSGDAELPLLFPEPGEVVKADLRSLGMPAARKAALVSMAKAALAEPELFDPLATVEETVARLRTIPGVGDWTAQYIALRASREPDAFPSTDVALLRGAKRADGTRPTPAQLLERAEKWRPWRAYAAQYLWTAVASHPEPGNDR